MIKFIKAQKDLPKLHRKFNKMMKEFEKANKGTEDDDFELFLIDNYSGEDKGFQYGDWSFVEDLGWWGTSDEDSLKSQLKLVNLLISSKSHIIKIGDVIFIGTEKQLEEILNKEERKLKLQAFK